MARRSTVSRLLQDHDNEPRRPSSQGSPKDGEKAVRAPFAPFTAYFRCGCGAAVAVRAPAARPCVGNTRVKAHSLLFFWHACTNALVAAARSPLVVSEALLEGAVV